MMLSDGVLVGWTINTSAPRTFSSRRTKTSPSAKRDTVALHRSMSSDFAIDSASARFALPVRTRNPCIGTARPSSVDEV